MSDPRRLREGGTLLEARAGRLLARAAEVEPWAAEERQATWNRLTAIRLAARSRGWLGGVVVAAAILVVSAALLHVRAPREGAAPVVAEKHDQQGAAPVPAPARGGHTIDLGPVGYAEATASAVYELLPRGPAGAQSLRLRAGRICATIRHQDPQVEGPFVLLAPRLRVVDLGTRFCVEVSAERTSVEVTEGEVRIEAESGRNVDIAAGQHIDSNDARLGLSAPPVPSVTATARAPSPATAVSSCERFHSLDDRERCYSTASTGDDLAAQNALYGLAILARDQRHDGASALALFRAYLERFPTGPLAPAASIGVLRELSAESRWAQAATEAERYLVAYPGEAQAPEVRLILANLDRERLGRPAGARAAYEAVLRAKAAPEIAGEALFGLALSEIALGDRAAAQSTLRRYLAEHPEGTRADDARKLLER